MEYNDTDQITAQSVAVEDYYSRFTGEEIDARLAAVFPHTGDSTIHITSAERTAWNGKQPTITDLATIRSGAALGATAVQPSALNDYATQNWVEQQGYLTEHQSLAGYAKKEDTVTELGVSGNYLTWKKNNIQQYLTVPYATKSADVLSSTWLEDLNEPIWSAGFGITLQEYNREAQNKPVTLDNANYIINIGGDQHSTNAHYGWQIAFADYDGHVYLRLANARWDGDSTSQAYGPWHRLAFADMPIERADTLTSWRKIWGQWFNGSGNVDGDMTVNGIGVFSRYLTVGNRQSDYSEYGAGYIELSHAMPYIDFHVGNSVTDYDARVIGTTLNEQPILSLLSDLVWVRTKDYGTNRAKLRIGDAILEYDATNKALFVKDANEQTMNLVATGDVAGFSAHGSFDSLTDLSLTDLSLTDWLKVGDWKLTPHGLMIGNDTIIGYDDEDSFIVIGRGIDVEINGDIQAGNHDMYIRSIESQSITTGAIEANTLYVSNGTSGTHNITDIHTDSRYVYITFKNGSTSRTMKLQPVSIS